MNPEASEFVLQQDTYIQASSQTDPHESENGGVRTLTACCYDIPDKRLPIPSVNIYRDMYWPPHQRLRPLIQRNKFPEYDLTSLPIPYGSYPVQEYNLRGLPVHHDVYVRNTPEKLYTRFHRWYLEIDDSLFHQICPADLNDLSCLWDELQGGCPSLRLCVSRRKYSHPHLGLYPECNGDAREVCMFIHDIAPTCWSLHEQLIKAPKRQFRSYQTCPIIAKQTDQLLNEVSSYCRYGHDMEGARVEAWWNYWEHRTQAIRRGASGIVTMDRYGVPVRQSIRPKRQTLGNTSQARNLDGSLSGRTWHGKWVTMTCMVGSERPVDFGIAAQGMVVDWERCELRPLMEVVEEFDGSMEMAKREKQVTVPMDTESCLSPVSDGTETESQTLTSEEDLKIV